MADMTQFSALQSGEAAIYRHNPRVLRFITLRKFHDAEYVMNDGEYATAMTDPLNVRFARAFTVKPQGTADVHLRSHR